MNMEFNSCILFPAMELVMEDAPAYIFSGTLLFHCYLCLPYDYVRWRATPHCCHIVWLFLILLLTPALHRKDYCTMIDVTKLYFVNIFVSQNFFFFFNINVFKTINHINHVPAWLLIICNQNVLATCKNLSYILFFLFFIWLCVHVCRATFLHWHDSIVALQEN